MSYEFWRKRATEPGRGHPVALADPEELAFRESFEFTHVDWILGQIPSHLSVVEPGCGTGRWTPRLLKRFDTVNSYDFIEEFVEETKRAAPGSRVHLSRFSDWRESSDVLFSAGCMVYLTDDEIHRFLAQTYEHVILVESFTPNDDNNVLRVDGYSERLGEHYQATYRNTKWWERTLFENGFRVRYEAYIPPPGERRSRRGIIWASADGE